MNGFVFNNEVPASIMYFLVNDPYGNVKSVQFNYQNFFISIPMTVQTDFNMDGIMYFPNSSDPAALFYTVPTTDPSHGFWIMTRRNNYYFNIYNRDNSGNDINSFRTHHNGVYSLVPFTCEVISTFNGDAEFNV